MIDINIGGIVGSIVGLAVGLAVSFIMYSVIIPLCEDFLASLYGNMTSAFAVLYAPTGILVILLELLPFITTLALIVAGYAVGKKKFQ